MTTTDRSATERKSGLAETKPEQGELLIIREFKAPRSLVWRAFTDPELMKRWWGPKDFTAPVCKIDLHVGGKYLSCMRSPDGKDYWSTGTYREIDPQKRIVCTDSFADVTGKIVPASYYGMDPKTPLEMLLTVTLADIGGGKTRLTLRHAGFPSDTDCENAQAGWEQSLDKLAIALKQ